MDKPLQDNSAKPGPQPSATGLPTTDRPQFMLCGHVQPMAHWRMLPHLHADYHELIVVLAGRIQTAIGGQILEGAKGDVLLYPAGLEHHEQAMGDEALETYFISWRPWQGRDALATAPAGLQAFDRDGRMLFLARWLSEIASPQDADAQSLANSLLEVMLGEYQQCIHAGEHNMVLRVKRYVQANLTAGLALDDLAGLVGMSKFHFSRLFSRAAGMSPMRFVRRCRVDYAAMLIQTTPLPLKAVAAQAGFANEYHLSRVFHQTTGVSPGAYRRK